MSHQDRPDQHISPDSEAPDAQGAPDTQDAAETADATQEFLNALPEVRADERFQFACHPGVPCFNACCSDLNLQLTPYDALRLRKSLGLASRDFMGRHAHVGVAPDTGFPSLALRMQEVPGRPCPFVTAQGCSVYPNRPGACRTYPIGRASRLTPEGEIATQFFLVREPHCRGFEQEQTWDPMEWVADQGLEAYNAANDRLVRVMARQKRLGRPLEPRQTSMALLALYQPDSFQQFIKATGLMDRLDLTPERAARVLDNEEAALELGLDWLELAFFGECPTLSKKG